MGETLGPVRAFPEAGSRLREGTWGAGVELGTGPEAADAENR